MAPLLNQQFKAFVGIDWSDTKHDICLQQAAEREHGNRWEFGTFFANCVMDVRLRTSSNLLKSVDVNESADRCFRPSHSHGAFDDRRNR
jgi:hypothetical protein